MKETFYFEISVLLIKGFPYLYYRNIGKVQVFN